MKSQRIRLNGKLFQIGIVIITLGVNPIVWAADNGTASENPNRFRASAQFLFNISARFYHQPTMSNPGDPTLSGIDRIYDNGYVRVDDSGNAGGMTWNWGFYDNSSVVGTSLQLKSVSSPADGTSQKKEDNPQYGFEIGYGRVLHTFNSGTRGIRLGIDGAFGVGFLNIKNNTTISGRVSGVMDTYDLSGLPIIPFAPYYGSSPVPGGPVPLLISDRPVTRTPIDIPATATEYGKIDGTLYGFKLGPFVEFPLSDKVNLQVRGGFASILADSEFSFRETVSTGATRTGSIDKDKWLFGGYAEAQISVDLSKHWQWFLSGGYQNVGDYSLGVGGKSVNVKMDGIFSLMTGFSFTF